MNILTANWLFPIISPPIRNGALLIDQNHKIIDIGQLERIKNQNPNSSIKKLDGAILPGFINAHTHLELSGMHNSIEFTKNGMSNWLHRLNDVFANYTTLEHKYDTLQACRSLTKYGTVAVGDISNTGISIECLMRENISGTVFLEYLDGLGEEIKKDEAHFCKLWNVNNSSNITISLSPHALYSTSSQLIRKLQLINKNAHRISTIHWKESLEEVDFVEKKTGNITGLMERIWPTINKKYGNSIMNYDEYASKYFNNNQILVHCVHSSMEEINLIKKTRTKVILCPRSNMNISGKLPPIREFEKMEVNYALATDSLASVQDLDIRNEVKYIRESFPEISYESLLKSITINPAEILNLSESYGRIKINSNPKLIYIEKFETKDNPIKCLVEHIEQFRIKQIT